MDIPHLLLIEAARKLIELQSDARWQEHLPLRCPPVLWFGNSNSSKQKLLTLGANPSRKEFLNDLAAQAVEKVRRSGDQSLLSYREPPGNRLRMLHAGEGMSDVIASRVLREQIIASYNDYFLRWPYKKWFGCDAADSYNVEGFLRGFGASYYQGAAPMQAIHVDLFPFPTLGDFGEIEELVAESLFGQGWAQAFVERLIRWFSPAAIVVFGRTNCRFFAKHLGETDLLAARESYCSGKSCVIPSHQFGLPIVGLTTNLGTPKGFNKQTLRSYGEHIGRIACGSIVASK